MSRWTMSLAITVVLCSGCKGKEEPAPSAEQAPSTAAQPEATQAEPTEARADLKPTAGHHVEGAVRFFHTDDGVRVTAKITGLDPNQKHGFHVHDHGDCSSPDGKSAGGHYNPGQHPHGLPGTAPRHAGDLGNLEADAKGHANIERTFDTLTIAGTRAPVIGRAVIVHAQPDDGGQPTGNAGARVACGVIEAVK